jgi:hypothetical protein
VTVGRPREFDPDWVEEVAMKLFWKRTPVCLLRTREPVL